MRLLALWLLLNVLLTAGYQQTNAAPADSASTDEGVSGSDNCSPRPLLCFWYTACCTTRPVCLRYEIFPVSSLFHCFCIHVVRPRYQFSNGYDSCHLVFEQGFRTVKYCTLDEEGRQTSVEVSSDYM